MREGWNPSDYAKNTRLDANLSVGRGKSLSSSFFRKIETAKYKIEQNHK